jgi:hypothetical protein
MLHSSERLPHAVREPTEVDARLFAARSQLSTQQIEKLRNPLFQTEEAPHGGERGF